MIASGIMFSWSVFGQKVTNVKAALENDKVIITYDLEGKSPTDRYSISLLSSVNNFTEPLQEVEGEVGAGIRPGTGLTITWNARKEVDNFNGNVTFEVKATLMTGFFTIKIPSASGKYKKGKALNINWSGGNDKESVKIELLKSDKPVALINDHTGNTGSYKWEIPRKTKSSANYRIKITDLTNPGFSGLSGNFKISSKLPVAYIIIPGVVVLGTIAYLVTRDHSTPVENNNALPVPPNTPGSASQ